MRRMFLFLIVNVLVVTTIGIIMNLLGVRPYINAYGLDYQALLIFCLIWGMVGSFISLGMSKWMAKMMMGVQIVDDRGPYAEVVRSVHRMAKRAGIEKMPEVGVYNSPDVNAFATGATKNRALVAVSTGLLERMDKDEIDGVLGHEVSHIANGDMVTMALVQGIVNAFVMFFSRVAAFAISNAMKSDDDERAPSYFMQSILAFVFDILFSFLAMPIVAWFSRYREYRADTGGAFLAGKENMIAALTKLQQTYQITESVPVKEKNFQSMQISSRYGWMKWFSTHPPLEQRIKALQRG